MNKSHTPHDPRRRRRHAHTATRRRSTYFPMVTWYDVIDPYLVLVATRRYGWWSCPEVVRWWTVMMTALLGWWLVAVVLIVFGLVFVLILGGFGAMVRMEECVTIVFAVFPFRRIRSPFPWWLPALVLLLGLPLDPFFALLPAPTSRPTLGHSLSSALPFALPTCLRYAFLALVPLPRSYAVSPVDWPSNQPARGLRRPLSLHHSRK